MNNRQNFTHLLLTRFNLQYSRAGNSEYICNDEWHQERFELFNRFCLPSVARQTSQRFKWLIFFNEEKRELYKNFIAETEQNLPIIEFIYVKPDVYHKDLLDEYISRQINSEYLITTRLDNDDCIASHFMELIQEKFFEVREDVKKNDILIDAPNGYQLEIIFPYRKSVVDRYDFSPFISLATKVKRNHRTKTVLDHQHQMWGKHISYVKQLSEQPIWAQIIHNKNVANKVLGLHLKSKLSDKNFPVLNQEFKNNAFTGALLLPLQFVITFFQRIGRKYMQIKEKLDGQSRN